MRLFLVSSARIRAGAYARPLHRSAHEAGEGGEEWSGTRFVVVPDSIFMPRRSFDQARFIPGNRIPEPGGQVEAVPEIDIQEE
jgi:hypothetical protein